MTVKLIVPPTTPAGALRRSVSVIERVLSMDREALARLRPVAGGLDIFLSTPLGCALSQRVPGAGLPQFSDATDSTVVRAAALRDALTHAVEQRGAEAGEEPAESETAELDLGSSMDMLWMGALPPLSGFALLDWVPAQVLREVYQEMAEEHETSGGPAGVAPSLLDQELVEVSSDAAPGKVVNLTGRMVATAGATGIISPPPAALQQRHPERDLDSVRVSATGSWIRVDGVFGTLYAPRPGGLARLP